MDKENLPRPTGEDEDTPSEEGFLKGWLKKRLSSEATETVDRPIEADEGNKESRVAKFFSDLRQGLDRRLGVEMSPVTETAINEPEESAPGLFEGSAVTDGQSEEAGDQHIFDWDEPTEEAATIFDRQEADASQDQTEQPAYQASDSLPPVVAPNGEIDLGKSRRAVQEASAAKSRERLVVNESVDHPVIPTNTLALSTSEILRRQREKQIRKHVRQLQREASDTRSERKEVAKQQDEFQRRLDEQVKIENALADIKTADHKIHKKPFVLDRSVPDQPKVVEAPKIEASEAKPIVKTEVEKLKEIVNAPPPEKPEVILQSIEKAADNNVAVEGMLERRHEVKGEDSVLAGAAFAATVIGQPIVNKLRKNGFYQPPIPMTAAKLPEATSNKARAEQAELYRKAAYSGFWTAILICLLILIVSNLH